MYQNDHGLGPDSTDFLQIAAGELLDKKTSKTEFEKELDEIYLEYMDPRTLEQLCNLKPANIPESTCPESPVNPHISPNVNINPGPTKFSTDSAPKELSSGKFNKAFF